MEEINCLRENNKSLGEQIAEGIRFKKIIEIQNNLIKELKEESKEKDQGARI